MTDMLDPLVPLKTYPLEVGDEAAALSDALYAIAAELRTANLIAFKVAQQTALADCSNAYLAPIHDRLGLVK